jgi:hypothetical protein
MIHKLRNTPVREFIRAIEQDGFQYKKPSLESFTRKGVSNPLTPPFAKEDMSI